MSTAASAWPSGWAGRGMAKDVVTVLEDLTSLYPATAFIRSDTGYRSSLRRLYGNG